MTTELKTIETKQIAGWIGNAKKHLFIHLFVVAAAIRFILCTVFIMMYFEMFINQSGGNWFMFGIGIAFFTLPLFLEYAIGLVSFTTSVVKHALGMWIIAFFVITIFGFTYNVIHIEETSTLVSTDKFKNFIRIIMHFSNLMSFVLIELMGFLVIAVERQSSTALQHDMQRKVATDATVATTLGANATRLKTGIDSEDWQWALDNVQSGEMTVTNVAEIFGINKGTVSRNLEKLRQQKKVATTNDKVAQQFHATGSVAWKHNPKNGKFEPVLN